MTLIVLFINDKCDENFIDDQNQRWTFTSIPQK